MNPSCAGIKHEFAGKDALSSVHNVSYCWPKKYEKERDKDETSTNRHLQENPVKSYFRKLNPAIQINETLKRPVLYQRTWSELELSCGEFLITLRMQP